MVAPSLLSRITVNPQIFGGKPIIRGYPWLERDDIRACLLYAQQVVAGERIESPIEVGG